MKKLFMIIVSMIFFATAVLSFTACGHKSHEVSIKYYADGSQIVSAILGEEENIGLVPEPAASNLINRTATQGKTLYSLDLQELYDENSGSFPQAVLMVKESVLSNYPQTASAFESGIDENVAWAKTNTADAVNAVKSKLETSTLNINALSGKAIDGCKIYYESAQDSESVVKTYTEEIIALNSSSAKSVEDDFFYNTTAPVNSEKTNLSVYVPDGAPALAIAKFIADQNDLGTNLTVNYYVVATSLVSSQLVPAYRGGTADIIILPLNLATKFYNTDQNTEDNYKMVSVITHGNFYIISTEQITIENLKGKRIAVPQQNAIPDWTFRIVLKKHGLTGVNIED